VILLFESGGDKIKESSNMTMGHDIAYSLCWV
jgi:hypothetical protein